VTISDIARAGIPAVQDGNGNPQIQLDYTVKCLLVNLPLRNISRAVFVRQLYRTKEELGMENVPGPDQVGGDPRHCNPSMNLRGHDPHRKGK